MARMSTDLILFKHALYNVKRHYGKSFADFYNAYTILEEKYNFDWNTVIGIINTTTNGTLTSQQAIDMRNALDFGMVENYKRKIVHICLTVCIVLSTLGIFGNSLIVVYFVRKSKWRITKLSSYHFLIILLAVTDLFMCVSLSYTYYVEWNWKMNQWTCEYGQVYFKLSFPNLSFWFLISYERYRNIVRPFDGRTYRRKYMAIILAMIGICIPIPFVLRQFDHFRFKWQELGNNGVTLCYVDVTNATMIEYHATLIGLALLAFAPTGLTVYYYKKISNYMRNEERNSQNVGQAADKIRQRNKRALRVILLLILTYVVTSIPARGFVYFYWHHLIFEFDQILYPGWEILVALDYFSHSVTLLNNVINFVVYGCLMKGFQQFLLNVLTLGLRKKYMKRQNTTTSLGD